MIHLNCHGVQAGCYSNGVECWPLTQVAWAGSLVAALVISFSPLTAGAQCKMTHETRSTSVYREFSLKNNEIGIRGQILNRSGNM